MPGFDAIVDQERIVGRLINIRRKGNIPHALLFTGPEGTGKKQAAKVFAMACNCLGNGLGTRDRLDASSTPPIAAESAPVPCGTCRSCRKISAETHPDVIVLQPQKATIRISQIRNLCDMLAMKPYEAKQRVVVIADAQTMSPEAGNALLKLLEEPPDNTLLILTAPHSQNLLPTIVSRCQHFRFRPITQETLQRLLMRDYDLRSEDAAVLSVLANGSRTKACALAESAWLTRRQWMLNMLGETPPQGQTAGQTGANLALALADRIAGRKDEIGDMLDMLQSWFRDLMIYPLAPDKIMNTDMTQRIQLLSRKEDARSFMAQFEAVQTARDMIAANANPRLTLDVMMLRLLGT